MLPQVESSNVKKYWMVQHWGRIGTGGQNQVKEFGDKATALKEFNKKFKSKVRLPQSSAFPLHRTGVAATVWTGRR